jgi:hypothetical protein
MSQSILPGIRPNILTSVLQGILPTTQPNNLGCIIFPSVPPNITPNVPQDILSSTFQGISPYRSGRGTREVKLFRSVRGSFSEPCKLAWQDSFAGWVGSGWSGRGVGHSKVFPVRRLTWGTWSGQDICLFRLVRSGCWVPDVGLDGGWFS